MATKDSYQRQEAVLLNLFSHFSYFGFDKAREQTDKERDNCRNSGTPIWISLLSCISQLAVTEKSYMNLSFLAPKGFLRKESSLRLTYETLLTELAEIEKKYPASSNSLCGGFGSLRNAKPPSKNKEKVLVHLSQHLVLYIQARLLMLSFYEKLVSAASGKVIKYEEPLENISEIIKKNSAGFHHPVLAPLRTLFNYECDIINHLMESLKSMQEWEFLPSLLHLNDAHLKLIEWQAIVQSKESKKYTFGASFLKSSSQPALYNWFWQAKASFVSKFSIYFYDPLASQTSSTDMRNLLSKQSCDYVTKIQTFHRKTDVSSIGLLLDASSLENYRGRGYHHPSHLGRSDTTICPYPVIFCYPTKCENASNVAKRLSAEKGPDFAQFGQVVHHIDPKTGSNLLLKVEPHVIIVACFDGRKSEKEAVAARDFLLDLATHLRCTKIFASLKSK